MSVALEIEVTVLRSGRRVCLLDVALGSGTENYARARGLFAAGGGTTVGETWTPSRRLQLPPDDLKPASPEDRLYFSEKEGWTSAAAAHQNSTRKQLWHRPIRVVDGEDATVFQTVAGVADLASVVTHWGSGGLAFINADLTLSLARLPTSCELGVAAVERVEADGIAVGTALVYDRAGVIGTSTVSALANADHVVDPRSRDRPTLG